MVDGSGTTTYTYNAGNRLTLITDPDSTVTTNTYDNNGNRATTEDSNGTATYTWDYENRLLTVALPTPATVTFTYNGAGKRIQKEEGIYTTKFLYDQDKIILEKNAADTTLVRNTHEGGSLYQDLISMRRGGNSYYHLFDGLGSVVQMVDASENTQNSYTYEAFGQIKSSSENVPNRYKFVGAYDVYYDATPALYFMQARYYDPWRGGRFITMDPLRGAPQDPRSLHRYVYAHNNPVLTIDPTGLIANLTECLTLARDFRNQAAKEVGTCGAACIWAGLLKGTAYALLCALAGYSAPEYAPYICGLLTFEDIASTLRCTDKCAAMGVEKEKFAARFENWCYDKFPC